MLVKTKNVVFNKKNGRFTTMWTKTKTKKARRLYVDQLYSIRDLAKHFECAPATVQQLLEREGWVRRKQTKYLLENAENIKKWYLKDKLTQKQIAEKLGVKVVSIAYYIGKFPWKRSNRESKGLMYGQLRGSNYKATLRLLAYKEQSPKTYTEYRVIVGKLTAISKTNFKHLIHGFGGKHTTQDPGTHVDHMLSIKDGWFEWSWKLRQYVKRKHIVSPLYLAHPLNLQLITAHTNSFKQSCSILSPSELKLRVDTFNNSLPNLELFDTDYLNQVIKERFGVRYGD